jgi:hypothetical protein
MIVRIGMTFKEDCILILPCTAGFIQFLFLNPDKGLVRLDCLVVCVNLRLFNCTYDSILCFFNLMFNFVSQRSVIRTACTIILEVSIE